MNIEEILFRCSGLGNIMTNDRSGKDMGETAKAFCRDLFIEKKYHRRKEITSKYFTKGNACEEDSIVLLCVLTRMVYTKNEENFKNGYICGTPDLWTSENGRPDVIEDIKSAWDIFTFNKAKNEKINKDYYYQLMGYMALTGAKSAKLRYVLVNATADLIEDEKRKLRYQMKVDSPAFDANYIKGCQRIERNMIYDMGLFKRHYPDYDLHTTEWEYDIPAKERLFTFYVERNENEIKSIYDRVNQCRQYIKSLIEQ